MGRVWTRPRTPAAAQLLRPDRTPDYPIIADPEDPINSRSLAWWPISKSASSGQTTGILPDISGGYTFAQQFGSWRDDLKAFYCNAGGYFIDATGNFPIPDQGLQSTDRTISAWIKLNASAADGVIAGHFRDSYWDAYGLGLKYDSGEVAAMGEANNSSPTLTYALTDTAWHHVVGVFAAGGQLWVDGILRDSGTLNQGWIYDFGIGVARGEGTESRAQLDGYIKNVQYWTRRLNEREIRRLYSTPFSHAIGAFDNKFLFPEAVPPATGEDNAIFMGSNF